MTGNDRFDVSAQVVVSSRKQDLAGMGRNSPGGLDVIAGATLLGRVADPDEAVGLIQFLLSDASAFITGADHEVSGGRR